jgi:hypothetical protein
MLIRPIFNLPLQYPFKNVMDFKLIWELSSRFVVNAFADVNPRTENQKFEKGEILPIISMFQKFCDRSQYSANTSWFRSDCC